jgi:hypothetical protein
MKGRSLIPTNLRKLMVVGIRDDKFFEYMRKEEAAIRPKSLKNAEIFISNRRFFLPIILP